MLAHKFIQYNGKFSYGFNEKNLAKYYTRYGPEKNSDLRRDPLPGIESDRIFPLNADEIPEDHLSFPCKTIRNRRSQKMKQFVFQIENFPT